MQRFQRLFPRKSLSIVQRHRYEAFQRLVKRRVEAEVQLFQRLS